MSDDDGTNPGWGAGSSAYARLRRLNDDDDAGRGGFFDRTDDRFDDPPPAGAPASPPAKESRSASRRRRAADRSSERPAERTPERAPERPAERGPERPAERTSDWDWLPDAAERTRTRGPERAAEPPKPAERTRADATRTDLSRADLARAELSRSEPTRAELARAELGRPADRSTPPERTNPAEHTNAEERPAEPVGDESGRHGKRRRSAGRNVPVSIAVGIALAGTVLGVLFYAKPWFIAVLVTAACVGIWELVRAIRNSDANPPAVPLMVGGAVMLGLAWFRGVEALSLGLLVTVLAVFVWRLADGPAGYQRDMGAAALITVYVPFLLGFAAPLATPDDGQWRILTTLAAVVLSDTGGFVAGVLFGKRPMAPTISPKKSWEGFGGSMLAAAIGSAVLMWVLFDVAPWWGALFGAVIAVACVLGDLAESLLKRDLGIKDMSNLLPGHGGLMDRLDSILFALPTAYLLFQLLAPPA